MGKDPAFLFYPGDWLGGTMTFTRHHKGAYMDLLMAQFNEGHLSVDQIKTVLGEKDECLWENVLKKKFIIDVNGLFYNEKLEKEIIKRKNFTESRRKNLTHMGDHIDGHMGDHMENGNGNRNKDIIKNDKKKKGYSKEFLSFYDAYPKHIGREPAWKVWNKLNGEKPDLQFLLDKIKEMKESDQWKKDNGKFIPHPETWLNQKRWTDELNKIPQEIYKI